MIRLTPELRAALRAQFDSEATDKRPLVKLFNPLSAATWLASELAEDGDTLFGLADLGLGCPELGYFSLREIKSLRLPFGLRIERDLIFATDLPLSVWADWARKAGSILWDEALLRRARDTATDIADRFPPSG
ncbi:DUF2958 domain-containing protein [Sphingomonas psychrotolerans]|uniref:DUF2958 domain-containing protein n=1 Tax=Sphingomonas psychrotolerans TaxID=1327635 RepID=A0ABU3N7R9_9SPHN|nr:DUF2958 domain-containing protein [Sphingomonas psychrotolerans]MDT8760557.1 DUF2958 domain-containing protein [Sphingomonas psychrotolerans]